MRQSISVQEGLSKEDRHIHNLRVARLASVLQSQGFLVVVAVIAPFSSARAEVNALCNPIWIYLKRSGLESDEKPYEEPENPHHIIDIDHSLAPETLLDARKYIEKMIEE
jgi:adenylylsulfate kinase-like enzyme